MFPSLQNSLEVPLLTTPAPYWRRSSSQLSIKRSIPCSNAIHSSWSSFVSGDEATQTLEGKTLGPGGALSLASQPGLIAARAVGEVWIRGRASATRRIQDCVGLVASRQAMGELWLSRSNSLSVVDENLEEVASVSCPIDVSSCTSGEHPRIAILGGDTIIRADLRVGSCESLTCAKPQSYRAGWTTDWEGTGIYNWSAVNFNPRKDYVLAAVSQRYRSLVIFDTRRTKVPLVEWSLPAHSHQTLSTLGALEWDTSGQYICTFTARSRYLYTVIAAGSYAPMFSDLQVIEHNKYLMGASYCGDSDRMLLYDDEGSITTYLLCTDHDEAAYIGGECMGEHPYDTIACDNLRRKFFI